jgi:hypothetical protein
MLGFRGSKATVSRYVPTGDRRRGQSWRTFIRNQTIAFSYHQHPDQQFEAAYVGRWHRASAYHLSRRSRVWVRPMVAEMNTGHSCRTREESLRVLNGAHRALCAVPCGWTLHPPAHAKRTAITLELLL